MNGVPAGFLTNYGADLTQPAWLYIVVRRLGNPAGVSIYRRLFDDSRELPAIAIFVAASITEFSQQYWPEGVFRGTFDPLDIIAFAVSVASLYAADKYQGMKSAVSGSG